MLSIEDIARALGNGKESKVGDGWVTTCPAHDDRKASLSVRSPHGKILVKCHAGCKQDDIIQCLIERDLWPKKRATESWRPMRPVPKGISGPTEVKHSKHGKPARSWEYRELDGTIIGFVHRFETKRPDGGIDKTVIPMSYCYSDKGNKAWLWKSFDKPRPFYNLPLFQKLKEQPVIVFEGEKTADAAQKIFKDQYVCTAWPGGAAAVKYADMKYLAGRTVILWPDNDEPGFKAMNTLAEILITEFDTTPSIVDVPHGLPEGWDLADDIPEGFSLDAHVLVTRAKPYVRVSDPQVADVNREFAFVVSGGKPAIIFEKKQPDGSIDIEYWSTDAFRQYFANQVIPNGRQQVKLGDFWLTHPDRRTYRGIIFEPGKESPDEYNLWQGYSFEPDESGDWSIFEEHLRKNVCQEDEELYNWVFGWFAHIMQNPAIKAGTSLSLRGQQGSGKTIVGKVFGRLIKRHYTLIDQERYLFGNFNSHMASTLLLHSDEGFWGGDPRHVGKLKSLVTSDTHHIERKGRDSLQVNNYLRLLITSNEDWVIPAAFEERRFAVLDVGNGNQQDEKFFTEMLKQLESGGYAALLYDLLHFDLSQTHVNRIPQTKALAQQKETSMDHVEQFWFTCLQQGNTLLSQRNGWLQVVRTADLHDDYILYSNKLGIRRVFGLSAFFRSLRRLVPDGSMERKIIGLDRQSAVTIPRLDVAREFFDNMMRTKHDWVEVDIEGDDVLDDPFKDTSMRTQFNDDEEIPF